jgi:hypothetical protein
MKGPHPHDFSLSLFASNDTGWWQRRSLTRHLRNCGECQEKVAQFESLREEMAGMSDIPPSVNWESLAAEMRANIRLGLEAGECVRAVPVRRRMNPRIVVAFASLSIVVAASFLLRGSRVLVPAASTVTAHKASSIESASLEAAQPTSVLEANEDGIALRTGPASMTLLGRQGSTSSQTASAEGEIRARYVDGNTGVVTINNVYLQ